MYVRIILVLLLSVFFSAGAYATVEDSLSIGQRFHQETGYGDEGAKAENPVLGRTSTAVQVV